MFDCVGTDVLFEQSQGYLKPEGKYISLVGGKSQGLVPFVKYNVWWRLVGGNSRTFKIMGLAPSGDLAREVAALVEKGVIKRLPIGSEYSMAEAVEVSVSFEGLRSDRC